MIGLPIKKLFEVGTVACYLLAQNFGEPAFDFLQKRLKHWRYTIELQKQNLFLYLLFLRCTNGFTCFVNLGSAQTTGYNDGVHEFQTHESPFLPNWFINLASASSGIPIRYHFWSTFIGSATMNLVYIQSGSILLQAKHGHHLVMVRILLRQYQ